MKKIINVDLAEVYSKPKDGKYLTTLSYGDEVKEIESDDKNCVKIETVEFKELKDGSIKPLPKYGYIKKKEGAIDILANKEKCSVLKVDFVDVQQGDGSVIETPDGKVVLIDGGDNQLFARYLANRFRNTSASKPKKIDCIVISHGDADHFQGLIEIYKSQKYNKNPEMSWKKLFIHPERVYHNGLVKRPSKINGKNVAPKNMFGEIKEIDGKFIITELVDDIRKIDKKKMNKPFNEWRNALDEYSKQGDIEIRHLKKGDNSAFDFLNNEGVKVEVLGPVLTPVNGVSGLLYLGEPPKGPVIAEEGLSTDLSSFKGVSASHTINGHSIVLKMKYGNVNFLFAGDLNNQSERMLTAEHNNKNLDLSTEIFKVPHHGSMDYSGAFLKAVNPLISVVSSGDESTKKEYIHPRATLMAALGKHSRTEEPVIFVTELVAFFNSEGYVIPECHIMKDGNIKMQKGKPAVKKTKKGKFFAFSRTAFGIVKIRTNGKRLLVYTNSGQDKLKEAYAYEVCEGGEIKPIPVIKA